MKKYAYVQINGGLGKNIAFSQIAKEVKEKYDFLAVSSPYFDVFKSCPHVDYVYKPEEAKDFIFDAKHDKADIFIDHIYDTSDFIYKKVSYADAYRKMMGLPLKNNEGGSDTKTELEPLKSYPNLQQNIDFIMGQIKEAGFEDFILVQFEGGQSPLVNVPMDEKGQSDWSKVPTNYENEPLRRHYPFEKATEFVELFRKAHPKTAIINYALPNEHNYEKTFKFTVPYLVYYELAKNEKCKGAVTIDSSLQHLLAGVKKCVVIWGHSLPQSFGYACNENIIQNCNRDDILYFTPLGASGARVDYIEPQKLLEKVSKILPST